MNAESFIKERRVSSSLLKVISLIIFSFLATPLLILIPDYSEVKESLIFIWFLGINISIATIGAIVVSFFIIRQWQRERDLIFKIAENDIDNNNKKSIQKILNDEAVLRSNFEKERLPVNDLFRLIELAKDKTEEIPEKITTSENKDGEKKDITEKTCTKSEVVNLVKLEEVVKLYLTLITKQEPKST